MMKYRYFDGDFYPYDMQSLYMSSGTWPDDGVDVGEDIFLQFKIDAPPAGMMASDDNGYPCWIASPSLSRESIMVICRARRDAALADTGWIVERHRDQLDQQIVTTITAEKYTELLTYRQILRDWPAQPGWPDIEMPEAPEWLIGLLK